MRILFYYYLGAGGALSNIQLLLTTIARNYPDDQVDILTLESCALAQLREPANITVLPISPAGRPKEFVRLEYGFGRLDAIARERKADVIWAINTGAYRTPSVPQVLGVHNSYMVYPWSMVRYHTGSHLNMACLRLFFNLTLAASQGSMVQTGLMGEYIRKLHRAPAQIEVIPKSVERPIDVSPAPLPPDMQAQFHTDTGSDTFTFLYVATGPLHKNHITVFKALDLLRAQQQPIRLAVSLSSEEVLGFDRELGERLLRSRYLLPLGWVAKQYLRALYDACDACVMPSVLESLSSSHLEAMQWEKAQISADLPYAHDLCGDASLYAAAEDPQDWAAKMLLLRRDAGMRQQLIRAGQQRMTLFPATWADAAARVRAFLAHIAGMRDCCCPGERHGA